MKALDRERRQGQLEWSIQEGPYQTVSALEGKSSLVPDLSNLLYLM